IVSVSGRDITAGRWKMLPKTLIREERMSPELRESRVALLLLALSVVSVLVFGAATLIGLTS
ncbi:hypothetical protein, partial [Proteus mirabilis]